MTSADDVLGLDTFQRYMLNTLFGPEVCDRSFRQALERRYHVSFPREGARQADVDASLTNLVGCCIAWGEQGRHQLGWEFVLEDGQIVLATLAMKKAEAQAA